MVRIKTPMIAGLTPGDESNTISAKDRPCAFNLAAASVDGSNPSVVWVHPRRTCMFLRLSTGSRAGLSLLVLAALTGKLAAQSAFSESFDYSPAGAHLLGENGGTGFAGP